jgi:phage/conjugal plasmid C-4 type zinc finger TraR family protein
MDGYDGTLPVTMDQCICHTEAVRRGAPNTFVIGDMPFGAYHASIEDAVKRALEQTPRGPSLEHCEECEAAIPQARRDALPGVRLCITCAEKVDQEEANLSGYNRRGSKDSQLR